MSDQEPAWNGFHLNPGGFFQYRVIDGNLQVRTPWGETVTDPKIHNFVTKVLIPFGDDIRKKAGATGGEAGNGGDHAAP